MLKKSSRPSDGHYHWKLALGLLTTPIMSDGLNQLVKILLCHTYDRQLRLCERFTLLVLILGSLVIRDHLGSIHGPIVHYTTLVVEHRELHDTLTLHLFQFLLANSHLFIFLSLCGSTVSVDSLLLLLLMSSKKQQYICMLERPNVIIITSEW